METKFRLNEFVRVYISDHSKEENTYWYGWIDRIVVDITRRQKEVTYFVSTTNKDATDVMRVDESLIVSYCEGVSRDHKTDRREEIKND